MSDALHIHATGSDAPSYSRLEHERRAYDPLRDDGAEQHAAFIAQSGNLRSTPMPRFRQ